MLVSVQMSLIPSRVVEVLVLSCWKCVANKVVRQYVEERMCVFCHGGNVEMPFVTGESPKIQHSDFCVCVVFGASNSACVYTVSQMQQGVLEGGAVVAVRVKVIFRSGAGEVRQT